MNRNRFLKNIMGLGLVSLWGCQADDVTTEKYAAFKRDIEGQVEKEGADLLKEELTAAWLRSEIMTLKNVKQMPPELFTFKYTKQAMTFAEQWRHVIIYTCGQLAANTSVKNPYRFNKPSKKMSKDDVIQELVNMYTFIRESIEEMSEQELLSNCDFAGDTIPVWRLYYALENHIIHHRGQCIVYLRLNGVTPKGYYGW